MPSLWASDITSSQASPLHLPGPMRERTRSEKISPPPPGTVARPAALKRRRTSAHGQVEEACEFDEFGRGEGVDVDGGEFFADAAEEVFVVGDGQVGVHAALHEDLGSADGDEFGDFFVDGVVIEGVGVGGGFGRCV